MRKMYIYLTFSDTTKAKFPYSSILVLTHSILVRQIFKKYVQIFNSGVFSIDCAWRLR